jgi:hypothetical protein
MAHCGSSWFTYQRFGSLQKYSYFIYGLIVDIFDAFLYHKGSLSGWLWGVKLDDSCKQFLKLWGSVSLFSVCQSLGLKLFAF